MNTRVPRNLHSNEIELIVDDVRNGLTDAIWRDDGDSSEMGLRMPSRVVVGRN